MRRREFITVLGNTTVAWAFAARAQKSDHPKRVGVLMLITENDPEAKPRVAAFESGLQELGWTKDHNVRVEYRWGAADASRLRTNAAELASLGPDVVLASGGPAVLALQSVAGTTPIVFVLVADPVALGFVESLARPAGNITGFSTFEFSMVEKWLELLKAVSPQVSRVAALFNPDTFPFAPLYLQSLKAAAAAFTVEVVDAPIRSAAEIERTIASFASKPGQGLIVLPDPFTAEIRELIIALAARYHLPALYPFRYYTTSGGLLSYGLSTIEPYRRAAAYVDRILKGARPSDLPVQRPTTFEFTINLKTANALGLTIPPALLARADEVIE